MFCLSRQTGIGTLPHRRRLSTISNQSLGFRIRIRINSRLENFCVLKKVGRKPTRRASIPKDLTGEKNDELLLGKKGTGIVLSMEEVMLLPDNFSHFGLMPTFLQRISVGPFPEC